MPNADLLILRAPSHWVQRDKEGTERECSSMATVVRRAVVRELKRSETDFGSTAEVAQ